MREEKERERVKARGDGNNSPVCCCFSGLWSLESTQREYLLRGKKVERREGLT